jgi:hypothetical protein
MSDNKCSSILLNFTDFLETDMSSNKHTSINYTITTNKYGSLDELHSITGTTNSATIQDEAIINQGKSVVTTAAGTSGAISQGIKQKKTILSRLKRFFTRKKGGSSNIISKNITKKLNKNYTSHTVPTINKHKYIKYRKSVISTKKKNKTSYTKLSNKLLKL